MGPINNIKSWWQRQTGEEETPLDGDTPAWVVSMLFHMVLLIVVAVLTVTPVELPEDAAIVMEDKEEPELKEVVIPTDFAPTLEQQDLVGANSLAGLDVAKAEAMTIDDISQVVPKEPLPPAEIGVDFEPNPTITISTAPHVSKVRTVKGAAGVGTTGVAGSIHYITAKIKESLSERNTLVVWMFDRSGSLSQQRKKVLDQFNRIYEELGIIEASGHKAFARKSAREKPLLTSIMSFGKDVQLLTKKPTDNLEEIRDAVTGIPMDESGVEHAFSCVYTAAKEYKEYRRISPNTDEPRRNVMFVLFTDEKGDDMQGLDTTIAMCRSHEIPVYVVGVPAPFGRVKTLVKWVHPDAEKFDQTPQWGEVEQGPESLYPERIKLHFAGSREDKDPIDSGFGPFALTRLCYETGGAYIALHPNRRVGDTVSRKETAVMSAHIKHFFDRSVMRKYRPDYVSAQEYFRRLNENKCRLALHQAAKMSWVSPMKRPRLRFEKTSEAAFVNAITEAQKSAARLEPKIQAITNVLALGENDRQREYSNRWQAGYDLAMGRALAVRVRTEAYNAMLAKAKTGLKFEDKKNNTWTLKPADEITVGSSLERMREKATMYLTRVVEEHQGTPWALLAQRELDTPIGWKWEESYTAPPPPRRAGAGNGNNNNPPPAQDDRRKMLMKRKPKPKVPKL